MSVCEHRNFGVLVVVGLVALVLPLLAGCDDDNVSVFIAANLKPNDEDCSLDVGNVRTLGGIWNVEIRDRYQIFPLFTNQLVNRRSDLRADPNGVFIQSAEVEIRNADGSALDFGGLPNPFSVSASEFVPSSVMGSPGQSVGFIEIIPSAYATSLLDRVRAQEIDQVIAAVRVFGETNGDVSVETDDWLWPIRLCTGLCLVECVDVADDAEAGCTPGQDFSTQRFCG